VYYLFGVEEVDFPAICIAAYEVTENSRMLAGYGTRKEAVCFAKRLAGKYTDRYFYVNGKRV